MEAAQLKLDSKIQKFKGSYIELYDTLIKPAIMEFSEEDIEEEFEYMYSVVTDMTKYSTPKIAIYFTLQCFNNKVKGIIEDLYGFIILTLYPNYITIASDEEKHAILHAANIFGIPKNMLSTDFISKYYNILNPTATISSAAYFKYFTWADFDINTSRISYDELRDVIMHNKFDSDHTRPKNIIAGVGIDYTMEEIAKILNVGIVVINLAYNIPNNKMLINYNRKLMNSKSKGEIITKDIFKTYIPFSFVTVSSDNKSEMYQRYNSNKEKTIIILNHEDQLFTILKPRGLDSIYFNREITDIILSGNYDIYADIESGQHVYTALEPIIKDGIYHIAKHEVNDIILGSFNKKLTMNENIVKLTRLLQNKLNALELKKFRLYMHSIVEESDKEIFTKHAISFFGA